MVNSDALYGGDVPRSKSEWLIQTLICVKVKKKKESAFKLFSDSMQITSDTSLNCRKNIYIYIFTVTQEDKKCALNLTRICQSLIHICRGVRHGS